LESQGFSLVFKKQAEEGWMNSLAMVVEPDEDLRRLVRYALREDGWRVVEACTLDEAVSAIRRQQTWPLIFCSDSLRAGQEQTPTVSATLETLRENLGPESYIVMVGAGNSPDAAVDAILSGASDFIQRPCVADDVRRRAREVKQRLLAALTEAAEPALTVHPFSSDDDSGLGMVGASEAVVSVLRKIAKSLANRPSTTGGDGGRKWPGTRVLSYFITGETGTGKEIVARLIHKHSRYAGGPFVPVNCGALPAELAESELFGHEPGAFTGAAREKRGLWESANGGTLFLDEITEAPRGVLPKLLRVLQDNTVKRLGSNRWIPVDVQVVAASNRDLPAEIRAGRFREDLYHRLSLFQFHLPPLRERRGDIPLLVKHFAARYASRPVLFSRDALDLLSYHSWPGNVRELENVVRSAVTHAADGMIYAADLLPRLQEGRGVNSACQHCSDNVEAVFSHSTASLDAQVKEFKLKAVKEALRQHRGNVTRAAAALGMTRPTLYKIIKGINPSD
jgi:two-component system, NtrC family, response regulator AtoC